MGLVEPGDEPPDVACVGGEGQFALAYGVGEGGHECRDEFLDPFEAVKHLRDRGKDWSTPCEWLARVLIEAWGSQQPHGKRAAAAPSP